MDPNAILKRMREIAKADEWMEPIDCLMELANLVEDLDKWLSSGGSLPDEWKEK